MECPFTCFKPPMAPEMCFGSLVFRTVNGRNIFATNNYLSMCQVINVPQGPVVLRNRFDGRVKQFSQLSQPFRDAIITERKKMLKHFQTLLLFLPNLYCVFIMHQAAGKHFKPLSIFNHLNLGYHM